MRAHHLVRQLVDRTGSDTAALVENAELARHAPCERQLLLNKEHGKPFFLVQLQDDVADFVDDIGMNPFSRLVKNQEFRSSTRARGRSRAAAARPKGRQHAGSAYLLQYGKEGEDPT